MILGPVSYLDCIVFCIFLTPQLLWHVGIFSTVLCALRALPFLVLKLPVSFLYERLLVRREDRSPFVQNVDPFEDFVIRCVRYAFANIPPRIGRVFFSKAVALPFLRYRMLRHGYLTSPVHWREYSDKHFKGLWIISDPMTKPDFVLYYVHGGGFAMGSSYFYLEFLLSWHSLLAESGFSNPAIFALDYTLVPDASYPVQLQETVAGYQHVLTVAGDASQVCVAGDSAGATLILSLLLHLGNPNSRIGRDFGLRRPELAALISPWTTLVSPRHQNNTSDYLDADALHRYGLQFAGDRVSFGDPAVSPGNCKDATWWRRASPRKGVFIAYGSEEVFAPEIEELIKVLRKAGVMAGSQKEVGGIHAWPVASLFLASSREKRLKGLKNLIDEIRECMG